MVNGVKLNSSSTRQYVALMYMYYHNINAWRYCFSSTCFEHYMDLLARYIFVTSSLIRYNVVYLLLLTMFHIFTVLDFVKY